RSQKSEVRSQKHEGRPWSLVPGHLQRTRDSAQKTKDKGLGTSDVLRMKLVGANQAAKVTALDELPGKSNYFIGNDPKQWRADVTTYGKVKYEGVYPGIDLVYYGNQRQLEYDFVLAPGADPKAITLAIENRNSKIAARQSKIQNRQSKIDSNGDLVVEAEGGEVRFHKPVVYQPIGAGLALPKGAASSAPTAQNRKLLNGRYFLLADNRVSFEIEGYDRSRPLIIDPVVSYSTYFGGSAFDGSNAITLDGSGNIYLTGQTGSLDFPIVNGFQSGLNGGVPGGTDAFVSKLAPDGKTLLYSTYLGGSGGDVGNGIAVDSAGDAYVTGDTDSNDFPTLNAIQTARAGGQADAFVAKLAPGGSTLVYSTYLGGGANDHAAA